MLQMLCKYMDIQNGRICLGCPLGYSSIYGQSVCNECIVGQYAFGLVTGFFSPSNASNTGNATSCKLCQKGKHGTDILITHRTNEAASCIPCSEGKYQNLEGQSTCQSCEGGKYGTDKFGTNATGGCNACPQGFYRPSTDDNPSRCSRCKFGKTTTIQGGARACDKCELGKMGNVSMLVH